ncbi:penicillin acylase family protein [Lentzea flava]|uniref:Penicillin amidase n=1 Tax=Lentzea flava TaxID=103732 RepID=A0ABQ2UZK1_9PSEU|nr:penicillin acylase family protein [Lentzea flava]MCP2202544.1 acyl-homoserine-lactone acylase [Lentzea flava]GGU60527.1 penicillin amidase [Lentzea flava]
MLKTVIASLLLVTSAPVAVSAAPEQVPHVVASNYRDLGDGIGFGQAKAHLCELAGMFTGYAADPQFRDLEKRQVVERIVAQPPPVGPTQQVRDLVAGYVRGYNRYAATHPRCNRPITEAELYRFNHAAFNEGIFRAHAGVWPSLPKQVKERGSNSIAVGSRGTSGGRGVLLGNPHVPWNGEISFWHSRLTIPGKVDVDGVTLLGMPFVFNGYNRGVAWSATVSTAVSYSVAKLKLVDKHTYLVDGRPERMIDRGTHWDTRYGPVTTLLRTNPHLTGHEMTPLPWTDEVAYAITDGAADRLAAVNAAAGFLEARTTADLKASLDRHGGTVRTNIIAADRRGRTLYAGIQVVPDVADDCVVDQEFLSRTSVAIVDGTRSACKPGLLPVDKMPWIESDTYATNSNSSHAFVRADKPLTGFPRAFGDEKIMNLRTEFGLKEIPRHLGRYDADTMRKLVLENRNTAAEKYLDSMPCTRPECEILRKWDRRNEIGSVGALLFDRWFATGGTPEAFDKAVAELGPKIRQPLGEVQYVVRNGRKIPLHGGPGASGVYNLINMDWERQEVSDGSSFIFAVEYTDKACPTAYTLMAPARPDLYSAKKWQKGALCR